MENEESKLLAELNGDTGEEKKDILDIPVEPKVEEEVKEEKPLPFNKDPKVQKYIEKEIAKALKDRPTEVERIVREEKVDEDPMTDVLTRVIGNDTPEKKRAIEDFKRALDSRDARVREEALREIDSRVEEERRAEAEAQAELVEGFENIEETFGVDLTSAKAQSLRSEFVDFIKRVAPKDENGDVTEYPDLEATFQLFQDTKKSPTASRAKELSSRSMQRSGESATAPKKGYSWRDVDKLFSSLGK